MRVLDRYLLRTFLVTFALTLSVFTFVMCLGAVVKAIDLLAPLQPGVGTGKGYDVVRGFTPRLDRDRYLAPEIEASARAVKAGKFAAIVRDQGGE